jgi:hypothetical protein
MAQSGKPNPRYSTASGFGGEKAVEQIAHILQATHDSDASSDARVRLTKTCSGIAQGDWAK